MAEDEEGQNFGALGAIIIFSFVSSVFLFLSLILLGSMNNFAIQGLYNVGNVLIANGAMPSEFATALTETSSFLPELLPYLDYVWFGSFISLIISTLIYSYIRKRENYFSLFSMAVLGIILFTYVGGIFIQLTNWFNSEVILTVFPQFANLAPIFSWYVDNIAIINIILISANILANFVDVDFSRFNKRKDGETLEEI